MVERLGQQLGNYRLIQYLGAGGFAEVYLGKHRFLNTLAAIKLLHAQLSEREMEQFCEEARTIAHLDHPNIIRVLDFGVEGKTAFLVMAYAPNGTLQQKHPRGELVDLPTVVSYVKQIAQALQYAHDQRLIHRDVKPGNMLIGQRGEVLLSDFGVAMAAHTSIYQGQQTMAGTIAYMAPEQIQARPHRASDQYALGVVVYQWLCGELPFHGTFFEVAAQHCQALPPPVREKLTTIPPAVEEVVMRALVKDPQQRFGSVLAFATALEQASQSSQSSRVIPPLIPLQQQVLPAPSRTHGIPRRTVLVGLALTGLAAVGGTTAWLVHSQKPNTVINTPQHNLTSTVGTTAAATSTPEKILYQANWSNGLTGWNASSDWRVLNGLLLNDGTGSTDFIPGVPGRTLPTILVPYNLSVIPNYAVEATIQTISQGHDPGFAFFLRYTADGEGYLAGATTLEKSNHLIGFRIAPVFDWLSSIKSIDYNPGTTAHVYRIELRGNNMKVYIDGVLLLDVIDNRYLSGNKVGLWDKHVQLSISSFKIVRL